MIKLERRKKSAGENSTWKFHPNTIEEEIKLTVMKGFRVFVSAVKNILQKFMLCIRRRQQIYLSQEANISSRQARAVDFCRLLSENRLENMKKKMFAKVQKHLEGMKHGGLMNFTHSPRQFQQFLAMDRETSVEPNNKIFYTLSHTLLSLLVLWSII